MKEKNPLEKIIQLAVAVKKFFDEFPYYEETQTQVAPIHVASWLGNSDLCRNIMRKTSETNLQVTIGIGINNGQIDGWTPLHMAAAHGHLAVVCMIMAHY